jgi:hypothetical protein
MLAQRRSLKKTNAGERLNLIQSKIDQARKHITTLTGDIQTFFESKPYEVGTKRDPQTRRLIYYVLNLKQVPPSLATTTGDAIQNLRTALDHLAYQLYLVGSQQSGNGRHIQFPIGKDAGHYANLRNGTTTGMRPDAITMLDSLQPYKGGKGHKFWVLQELNNADKHRFLIAVGSNFQSVNIGPVLIEGLREASKGLGMKIPDMPLYVKPQDTLFPLKVGDELFTDLPDATEKAIDFRFNIGLSVTGVIEKEPLLATLNDLHNLVSNTIPQFKPCLT